MQVCNVVNETQAFDSYSQVGDDVDLEFEVAKVEMGDNFAFIFHELENGDPLFVVFYNMHLHRCQQTFEDDWINIWYKENMILEGV